VIPWSPLARGVLAGNRTREGERLTTRSDTDQFTDYLYSQPTDFDVVDRVAEVAGAERSVPSAQVALAWLLHTAGVTAPIVGATKLVAPAGCARGRAADAERAGDRARLEEPYNRTRCSLHLLGFEITYGPVCRRSTASSSIPVVRKDRKVTARRRGPP
jgi:hypothetical protein